MASWYSTAGGASSSGVKGGGVHVPELHCDSLLTPLHRLCHQNARRCSAPRPRSSPPLLGKDRAMAPVGSSHAALEAGVRVINWLTSEENVITEMAWEVRRLLLRFGRRQGPPGPVMTRVPAVDPRTRRGRHAKPWACHWTSCASRWRFSAQCLWDWASGCFDRPQVGRLRCCGTAALRWRRRRCRTSSSPRWPPHKAAHPAERIGFASHLQSGTCTR